MPKKIKHNTTVSPKTHIIIKGAKVHNLKNIDVALPRNKFIVITGLSGSGKSSLAFDTLYAEGQRRYIESLSSYARQFLGKIEKPAVEQIIGISPAIAIEQKVTTGNSRSTVGTQTEIYDYLKILFARIGHTFSPISGREVKKDTPTSVFEFLYSYPENTKIIITSPFLLHDKSFEEAVKSYSLQGFSRVYDGKNFISLSELDVKAVNPKDIYLLIDRVKISEDEENKSRIFDSIETAFFEGKGECSIFIEENGQFIPHHFNNRFEADGITFEEPTPHFFSFNNPLGACKTCEGYGKVLGIDEDLVIPNKSLSVYEDAIQCWRGDKMQEWKNDLIFNAHHFNFPIHKPYRELTDEQKKLIWTGNEYFEGLNRFFKHLEEQSYKIQYRVMLSRYRGRTTCPDCKGTRLRKDAQYVKINGKSIIDLVLMPIDELALFFNNLSLNDYELQVAKRLLTEIKNRIRYIQNVGLGYLTLNRMSNTLSGGESQRINLAKSLGSSLVGSLYILDEPSIGLHSKDTEKLISVLKDLQKLGNTVIVVEHDEDIMKAADLIIDMGPEAGSHGGEVVFTGTHDDLIYAQNSYTAKYLTGNLLIETPQKRRKWRKSIALTNAHLHNLKNIDVTIPLGVLTAVTGVSGSGKSSLIKGTLYPALERYFNGQPISGAFDKLEGDLKAIQAIEFVDQNPIGKSSRSNPVTYLKAFDEIRNLFALQQLAKINGYKPSTFSFNVEGGRCENCKGEGEIIVDMQFMADVHLKCDVCHGKRYKDEVLEVKFYDKNIYDVLEMTVDDAIDFFDESAKKDTAFQAICHKINEKLLPLQEVGLGYVKLGQPSGTLSGGEAQRIKLASFLAKKNEQNHILFIFDEPTTGLHFHDVKKLLKSFNALINQGHSVLVIEHNLDVVKNADWIIDLGPEGGKNGGYITFEGTPEELIREQDNITAQFLREKMA
jgi:excinuclease ABC subunit A